MLFCAFVSGAALDICDHGLPRRANPALAAISANVEKKNDDDLGKPQKIGFTQTQLSAGILCMRQGLLGRETSHDGVELNKIKTNRDLDCTAVETASRGLETW